MSRSYCCLLLSLWLEEAWEWREGGRKGAKEAGAAFFPNAVCALACFAWLFQFFPILLPNRFTTNFFLLQNLCLKKSCEEICNNKTWHWKFARVLWQQISSSIVVKLLISIPTDQSYIFRRLVRNRAQSSSLGTGQWHSLPTSSALSKLCTMSGRHHSCHSDCNQNSDFFSELC